MKTIENRADIEFLVDEFYKQIIADDLLGYLFTDVFKLDFKKHKPVMCDFWETTLLEKLVYKGNPLFKHLEVNKLEPLKEAQFERWIHIWQSTINKHFDGERARLAIQRAKVMGHVIMAKIKEREKNKII